MLPVAQLEWDNELHRKIVIDIKSTAGPQKNWHGRQIRVAIEPQSPILDRSNVISSWTGQGA